MAVNDPVRIENSVDFIADIVAGVVAAGLAQPGDRMDLVNAPNAVAITAIQAGIATAAALAVVNTYTSKINDAASDGLSGTSDSVSYTVSEIERHLHGRARFWGSNGAPTETNAIDANVNTPFVATSGNNDWGAAIPICGTADNPVLATDVKFDPHLLLVTDTDHTTPYRIRFIYGTGTSAAAILAGQWSEEMFAASGGPFDSGVPLEFIMRRVDVGAKMWAQVWNATNASTVSFFWGAHGYEG